MTNQRDVFNLCRIGFYTKCVDFSLHDILTLIYFFLGVHFTLNCTLKRNEGEEDSTNTTHTHYPRATNITCRPPFFPDPTHLACLNWGIACNVMLSIGDSTTFPTRTPHKLPFDCAQKDLSRPTSGALC